jgi:hypothetical protein
MTDETIPIRQPSPFSDAGEATIKPVPVIPRDAKGRRVSQAAPAASPATAATDAPAPVDDPDDPYAEKRRTRVKVGTVKRKLYAPPREGFQRRFVNDLPGRVEDLKERGWDIVMKDGRPWTVSASQSEKLIAYLMEIPDEFYIEDDVSKQEKLDETDFAIYRGRLNEEPGDNRYVPRSTPIKMSVQRGTGKG